MSIATTASTDRPVSSTISEPTLTIVRIEEWLSFGSRACIQQLMSHTDIASWDGEWSNLAVLAETMTQEDLNSHRFTELWRFFVANCNWPISLSLQFVHEGTQVPVNYNPHAKLEVLIPVYTKQYFSATTAGEPYKRLLQDFFPMGAFDYWEEHEQFSTLEDHLRMCHLSMFGAPASATQPTSVVILNHSAGEVYYDTFRVYPEAP